MQRTSCCTCNSTCERDLLKRNIGTVCPECCLTWLDLTLLSVQDRLCNLRSQELCFRVCQFFCVCPPSDRPSPSLLPSFPLLPYFLLFRRGRPITLVGLNIALQQGDADFARKVAKVQPKVYQEFKEAYTANRWPSCWPRFRTTVGWTNEFSKTLNTGASNIASYVLVLFYTVLQ